MTTEQQIQLKQLEKECLELQIKLEELKKSSGTFTYPPNPNITPAFPANPFYYYGPTNCYTYSKTFGANENY